MTVSCKPVTTKAGSGMKDVRQALDEELEAIGTDYVNSFLLHWPYDFVKDGYPSMEEAWRGMIDLKKSGKAKSIGVSNFRVRDLQKLIDSKPEELPSINQIEYHPFVYEASEELYQFCELVRDFACRPVCATDDSCDRHEAWHPSRCLRTHVPHHQVFWRTV